MNTSLDYDIPGFTEAAQDDTYIFTPPILPTGNVIKNEDFRITNQSDTIQEEPTRYILPTVLVVATGAILFSFLK
jgi:hypothetical protein